jgi:hypothetical protein
MPILLSLLVAEGAESVYDISLVSQLCVEIVAEQNTEHTKELVSLLQAVVKKTLKKSEYGWQSLPNNIRTPSARAKPQTKKQRGNVSTFCVPSEKEGSMTKKRKRMHGTVERVIEPIQPGQPEKAQIAIEEAEHLYREVRVENVINDDNGEASRLKLGAKVDVILEADTDATMKTPA